ncbi:MAG: hypothetical protein EP329_07340 [Deltaproteobacteria bacterium]|nr:MAG: hypothetical protein EP329_07340 [Deltaproteobacteria bacterium]
MKLAPLFVVAFLASLAPRVGLAAEPELGLSGLFDVDAATWSGLDDQARLDLVAARADLAVALGVRTVRLGGGAPDVFSESALHGTFPWLFADRVVGVLAARDLDVVITLEQLVPASQKVAYRDFIERLVERYDGDDDFGVTGVEVQFDFPDIDGSGTITTLDWDAPAAQKAAWGAGHVVTRLEVGDRVRDAEDAGVIVAADYAAQLGAVQQAVASTGASVLVEVAGCDLDSESKSRFLDRLEGVDASALDAAGAHFRAKLADLDGAKALAALDNFRSWLTAAGLDGVEPWVTEMSVGGAAAGDGDGPCSDTRCSERTQVLGVVRFVLSALARGYTRVYYRGAVEPETAFTTVGLLTVPAASAVAPVVTDLTPRPAFAAWRQLQAIVAGGAVTKLGNLPTNVFGVQTAHGQVYWFDWSLEVGVGQPYDPGRKKEIVLRGLTSPAVRVVPLWPSAVAATLDADGDPGATWDEEHVAVAADGTAVVTVEQDPIWVSPSELPTTVEEDEADATDAAEEDATAEADAASGTSTKKGGCQAGGTSPPLGLALALAALVFVRRRRST